MSSRGASRTRRVGEQMLRALAEILSREAADPRFSGITFSSVKVSSDLTHATVLFTLPEGEDVSGVLTALHRGSGFLRARLADKLSLRSTPTLKFVYDNALEQAFRISSLLEEERQVDKGGRR